MHTKITPVLGAVLAIAMVSACSPKFDWRDYRGNEAPYAVLFPAKPATQTRSISLGGEQVNMQMAAAEVDGVTFAVGSAEMTDAAKAQAAVQAMKTAMVSNIGATITSEKQASAAAATGGTSSQQTSLVVEAQGSRNGEAMLLSGRFLAKDKRVYQVIAIGREKQMDKDAVDTFLSSFKLN